MSTGAGSGQVVDQGVAMFAARIERGIEVRHTVADVMDPGTPLGQEPGDRRVGIDWCQEFNPGIAEVEMQDPGAVGIFRPAGSDTEYVAIECRGGVKVGDGDAQMRYSGFHEVQLNAGSQQAVGTMSENTVAVTDATFDGEVINSAGLVLVDFWAAWCGPCRMIAPTLDALAVEYAGKIKIAKLDVDANQATSIKYNVRSIPAVIFFKDGKHIDTLIGAHPRPAFEAKIKQHLAA